MNRQKKEDLPHILVIDDDERICRLLSRYLSDEGFITCTASDPAEAREVLKRFAFDAFVVDVMMPGETGFEFTKSLRAQNNDTPVLLLTALGETDSRIEGLETGADDYLTKPFEPRELVLRLQAILRRRPKTETTEITIGKWTYDADINALHSGSETLRLTDVEGRLLRALASQSGEPISRDNLAELCGIETGERTIDVQVTRLRKKLEEDSRNPRHLQTVRGKGYLLRTNT